MDNSNKVKVFISQIIRILIHLEAICNKVIMAIKDKINKKSEILIFIQIILYIFFTFK